MRKDIYKDRKKNNYHYRHLIYEWYTHKKDRLPTDNIIEKNKVRGQKSKALKLMMAVIFFLLFIFTVIIYSITCHGTSLTKTLLVTWGLDNAINIIKLKKNNCPIFMSLINNFINFFPDS